MGNDEVSPVATTTDEPPGSAPVRHVYVIHDDATFSRILIGRCFPVPFTSDPTGLSCRDLPVATLGTIPPGGTCPTAKTGGNFPTLAIDKAGNLYTIWEQAPQDPVSCTITGDTVLKYSFSTDEGNHWSTPVTIPTPGLHNNVSGRRRKARDRRRQRPQHAEPRHPPIQLFAAEPFELPPGGHFLLSRENDDQQHELDASRS